MATSSLAIFAPYMCITTSSLPVFALLTSRNFRPSAQVAHHGALCILLGKLRHGRLHAVETAAVLDDGDGAVVRLGKEVQELAQRLRLA